MEKVYLLLRNNIESGPFTMGELLQQQLQPTDMLWIEGKSTGWRKLSEMEIMFSPEENVSDEDQPYLGDDIEKKAEDIRKRALSFKPRPTFFQEPAANEHQYSRGYSVNLEDSIEIVDHRKEKNKTLNEVIMTTVIFCLFAGGLYAGRTFINGKKEIISPAATQITEVEKKAPVQPQKPVVAITFPTADTVSEQTVESASHIPATGKTISRIRKDSLHMVPSPVKPVVAGISDQQVHQSETLQEEPKPVTISEPEITAQKKQVAEPANNVNKQSQDKKSVEESSEKKKGFLKGIFRKKNKDKDND